MRAAAVRYGPVFALTLLGAVLRFPTLDRQSFWLTVSLLDRGLGEAVAGSSLAEGSRASRRTSWSATAFRWRSCGERPRRILVLVGLVLVARLPPGERRGALVAGSLAAAVVLVPVALAAVGRDYVIARNAIVAVVPAAVCVGGGPTFTLVRYAASQPTPSPSRRSEASR